MNLKLAAAIRRYPGYFKALGWILALSVMIGLGVKISRHIDQPTLDFHSYFTAAHLVVEGEAIANFYDHEWFGAQAKRFAPELSEIFNANVPTTAVFFTPIALFETHLGARTAWTLMMLPFLVLLIEATARLGGIGSVARPYWYAAALSAQPIEVNLLNGQAYILVALGLVLFVRCWRRNWHEAAGSTLAVLFAFKSAGVMLWPLAAATGRWSLVWAGAVALAIIIAATWPLIGLEGWIAYGEAARELWASPALRATAHQSVPGILLHTLSDQPGFGSPVVSLSAEAVRVLSIGLVLALLTLNAHAARKSPDRDLVIASGILLTLVAVPVSMVHAYTVALVPIALLIRELKGALLSRQGLMMWLGAAVILLPSPFLSPRLYDGWAALIAYPKLYGALLLWALCLYLLVRPRKASQPAEGT